MIRIEANYPATDGSAPERIEITWEDQTPSDGELTALVDALGRVPRRYEERPGVVLFPRSPVGYAADKIVAATDFKGGDMK